MRDLFNSINNSVNDGLHKLDLKIWDKQHSSFVRDFIQELQAHLYKSDALHQLSKLSKDIKLEINEIEEEYFACYEPNTFDRYDIPKDMVDFSSKQQGYFCLQLQDDGLYHYVSKD